jgi:hypothetical protein
MAFEYRTKTVILLLVIVAVFTAAMGLPVPIGLFKCLMWNCIEVWTEMCCPKGKCGCQYFILLTLKTKNHGHRGPGFFLIKN